MSDLPFADVLRPELAELHAYVPVQGNFAVRLDANEAPDLLPAEAKARLLASAANIAWERYPDATCAELRQIIAAHCGVQAQEILVGVGSDEIISILLTALAKPRAGSDLPNILTLTPTFVMYRLSARARAMRVVEVPLDADWDLPVEAMKRGIEMTNPSIIFIATPNNPTGNLASRERLEAVIQAAPTSLVVVDEAYIDYADTNHLDLYRKYENVAILRTLSKVGFAALRLGWLIGRASLVRELDKVRQPYNINSFTQKLAGFALSDLAPDIRHVANTVIAERTRVKAELEALSGVHVTQSQANFLWVRTPKSAKDVFDELASAGVLVRSFHERGGRLANQLRVTIGTPRENDAFLQSFRKLI